MTVQYVPPTTTKDPMYPGDKEGARIDHPAFAVIGASRFTASPGVALFGSDFKHQAGVRITIAKASLRRHGSSEHVMGERELIEVELSEAQWARFVSAMNVGFGASCTLQHVGRERVPQIQHPEDRRTQFAEASAFRSKLVSDSIAEAAAAVRASGLSGKKQKEILDKLSCAEMNAGSNQEYTAEQFERHMERTVEHAAIEIDAMMTAAVHKVGLDTIRERGLSSPMMPTIGGPVAIEPDMDIYDCGIRTGNLLHSVGVHTLARAAEFSADGLLDNIKGFGPASIEDVRRALDARGLKLQGE